MIKELSKAYAPSAKEEEVRKIIIKDLRDFYSDIRVDNLGNLIIHKPGKMKTIAITSPMDEVSFLVTHEKDNYNLISTSICDVKPKTLQNIVCKDKNQQKYIISELPNNADNIEKIKNICFLKLFECKANSLNNEYITTSLIYDNIIAETDEYYIGKALERSVCCSVLCDIARNVANSIYEYYFVFSAQKYCDKKGALTATFDMKIDELYNLCCVDTDNESIELNKGPVIIIRDKMLISDSELVDKFAFNIAVQKLVSSNFISEGGYYQKQQSTQKVISVGIPAKFLGCFNEVISKNDVKELKTLILEKVLP